MVVVHVRAGSEYQAMLYLLRSVSRHFRMDDILPDVPEHIASHRYQILRPATGGQHLQFVHVCLPNCTGCTHTHACGGDASKHLRAAISMLLHASPACWCLRAAA